MGMVCKVVENILCIIHDHNNVSSQSKTSFELSPNTPVSELIHKVKNFFNYEQDSFELTLQKGGSDVVVVDDTTLGTLEENGFNTEPNSRNSLVLTGRGVNLPMLRGSVAAVEDDLSLGASASPTGCLASSSDIPAAPPLPPMLSSSSTSNAAITEYSYSTSAFIKHDTGYVGLVNQAMTCYLNSLLQALFMTPEFRNALYKWQFEANECMDETKSIPYQLQKLFLNLQTSNRNAVETTELTRSFGWDSSEAWQQHDIQELCRVMFDALEQVLKDTQQADLIDRLYQGKMIDYVRCLECSQEKSREDTFLDIPLPVRPFGSTVAYGSVEEALRAFVQPETLEGNNQYHCDQCSKKCDAHKGLKFSKFPYLLTLHLKRFDFDYNTMHRIKLNDKVVFPEILDLNSFIQQEKDDGSEGFLEELATGKCDDSSTTDSGSALDDESCQGTNELSQNDPVQEDDEGIDMSGGSGSGNHHENEKNRQHTMQKGPYVYELFSIMIHSGSASGGHYYAYIKDFANGEWFCFNDQTVNRITNDDLTKTYGGGGMRGYYSGAYSSSTNAYMLMYRQIDKERNCDAITVDEFPPHIKKLYKELQEREETDRQRKEKESEMYKFTLYCNLPGQSSNIFEKKITCNNITTLKEATELSYKILKLEGIVPIEQCRLVSYHKYQDTIEASFEGREDEPLVDILSSFKSCKYDLLMEIRNKDQKFTECHPGGTTLRIFVVDLETEEVEGPTQLRANKSQTVGELKESIGNALNMNPSDVIIVPEKVCGVDLSFLNDDTKTLKQECIHALMKIFVCNGSSIGEGDNMSKLLAKLNKILNHFENTITFHIALPDTDPETLNNLSIPMLNSPSTLPSSVPALTTFNNSYSSSGKHGKYRELYNANNDKHDRNGGGTATGVPSGTGDPEGGGGRSRDLLLPLLLSGGTTTAANATVTTATVACASVAPAMTSTTATVVAATATATTNMAPTMAITEAEDNGCQGAGGGDHSTSEDSSLTDSDRTLIGDPEDFPFHSPLESKCSSSNGPSIDVMTKFYNTYKYKYNNTGATNSRNVSDDWCEEDDCVHRYTYFKATPYTAADNDQKMLKVQVDKRMLLDYLKSSLEQYVGVPAVYFRIYRSYPGQQERECTSLKDSLAVFKDNEQLSIKLGRALRGNEHRVKVYQLIPDAAPPAKFLCDYIITKGQTVGDTKRELVDELNRKNLINFPVERCRLRKKNWKSPVQAYLDHEVWGFNIILENNNTDIFIQELPGPEIVKSTAQILLFLRRWYPSKYQLSNFHEIVMDGRSVTELKTKISEISEIPVENVEFAKPIVTLFPCDTSVLLVSNLDWNLNIDTIDQYPLQITDEGAVLFYKDNTEELKELTQEERKELAKENAKRNLPSNTISSYSPRKERPLKIYLDSGPRRPRTIVEPEID